ncbi:hypothetical protein J2046_004164 [Rhizobium petrolearium]|uniref:hypothetical protein n=1 Tax=Neorhizobium petrolearium TaxID=515361 RepID=UPI001AE98935|nr:hypothetical protein [Neorhizobium petrolearium]MBP1845890.1 hypothetical protein [Neorhizobium petrolearium]
MLVEPSVLANTIMAKLYNVLTNGDDTVPPSADNFFSWCTPGIPIEPADLEYLTQGLTGIVKRSAVDAMQPSAAAATAAAGGAPPPPPQPLAPEQLSELMAQDTMRLYMQAENMSRLLDFVPDVAAGVNDQFARMAVQNNDGTLSDVYDYTLRMSQVMKVELPPETVAEIKEMAGLMTKTGRVRDVLPPHEEIEQTGPSDLALVYAAKQFAYDAAALEYNARRIDALTATNSRAVHDWAINANIYRNKVRAAKIDWETAGHKFDVEKIGAYIEQVQRRDMALLKQQYVEDFENCRLTSPVSGADFFFTSLVPGNFANSTGWTRFGFSAGDYQSHSSSSYQWSRSSGGGGFSFFGIGGGGSHSESSSHSEYHGKVDSSHVSMSFEIAQIPIARPWFRPAFLTSHYWRFDQNNAVVKSERLSDGGSPPNGKMPAYPTSAIFVRKLSLCFGDSHEFTDFARNAESQRSSGGGYFCFGPFFAGGSGSHRSGSGDTRRDYGFRFENNTMFIDGMQLIGFKCHVMPKSPDPSSEIPANAWI